MPGGRSLWRPTGGPGTTKGGKSLSPPLSRGKTTHVPTSLTSVGCRRGRVPPGRHRASRGAAGCWPPRQPREAALSDTRLRELWRDLASADSRQAYRAVWLLAEHPGRAVAFLRQRLGRGVDRKDVERLIAELDSEEFRTRDRASRELAKLGRLVQPALEEGLRRGPSVEAGWRMRQLLRRLNSKPPGPEELRLIRAFEVLQSAGVPAARLLEARCR